MKFSISNIAWRREDDEKVAQLLKASVFTGIEIAPTRYIDDIEKAAPNSFVEVAEFWSNHGLSVTSIQSLLFNRPDLQLFGSSESRQKLSIFLLDLRAKATLIGVGPMVFGSPKNRVKGSLSLVEAKAEAACFFADLDKSWPGDGPYLVLEANPEIYGCDFMTTSSQARDFVSSLAIPSLRWHIDLACTILAGECAADIITTSSELPSHVHLSERNLGPLTSSNKPIYRAFLESLSDRSYSQVVTLEMKDSETLVPLIESIEIFQSLVP